MDDLTDLKTRRASLTVEQRAEIAHQLRRERGWSVARVAAEFGVSRTAVNYWLKKADPDYLARKRADAAFWREKNRYHVSAYHRQWREDAKHGHGVRAVMWREQDGCCYLCGRELGPHRMAVIEHDHRCCPPNKSCAVCRRGLACYPCNSIIGLAADDPDLLETIARNLRPALAAVTERLGNTSHSS